MAAPSSAQTIFFVLHSQRLADAAFTDRPIQARVEIEIDVPDAGHACIFVGFAGKPTLSIHVLDLLRLRLLANLAVAQPLSEIQPRKHHGQQLMPARESLDGALRTEAHRTTADGMELEIVAL